MMDIRDVDVAGKRVLLRAGLNVPQRADGSVADAYRLRRALMTIEYLASHGARTIIVAHLGRAGESLRPVYDALTPLTNVPISFFNGSLAEAHERASTLAAGECLMFENIRRFPGEEENEPALARSLAELGDLFVNDAFADSHRAHASTVGIAALLPSYAGLLMRDEIEHLTQALTPPNGSIAIVGGAKFETKQPLIEKLLGRYAQVCVGGAIANDFLRARGLSVGASHISNTAIPPALALDARLLLPEDVVVRTETGVRTCRTEEVAADEMIADVGPKTVATWGTLIAASPLVLWNGPLGIYEDGHSVGTDALAKVLDETAVRAIVGGGDTLAAIEKYSFDPARVFLSTGGGAMLQFLTDGTLPGVKALNIDAKHE